MHPATLGLERDLGWPVFLWGKRDEEKGGERDSEAHTYGSGGSPGYGCNAGGYGRAGVCCRETCREQHVHLPWPRYARQSRQKDPPLNGKRWAGASNSPGPLFMALLELVTKPKSCPASSWVRNAQTDTFNGAEEVLQTVQG
jgi:hypothetical protein